MSKEAMTNNTTNAVVMVNNSTEQFAKVTTTKEYSAVYHYDDMYKTASVTWGSGEKETFYSYLITDFIGNHYMCVIDKPIISVENSLKKAIDNNNATLMDIVPGSCVFIYWEKYGSASSLIKDELYARVNVEFLTKSETEFHLAKGLPVLRSVENLKIIFQESYNNKMNEIKRLLTPKPEDMNPLLAFIK